MKVKGVTSQLRMVQSKHPTSLIIDSKQALKEAVLDYIIHNTSGSNHHKPRKSKIGHYQPIRVKVQLNKQISTFIFDLPTILQKYTTRSQSNASIQDLTKDILEFIEQLQDRGFIPPFQLQGEASSDKILNLLIDRHFEQKRKQDLQGEYSEIKKLLSNNFKKVSFKVGQYKHEALSFDSELNSQRVSRSTLNALMERQQYGKKHLQVPNKSKLKVLVQSCNVFDYADKIQALKKQKLISQFCGGKESEYIETRQQVKKHYPCQGSSSLTVQTIQQLEDWINDISLSQALFKLKYEPKNQKNKPKPESELSSSDQQPQQ